MNNVRPITIATSQFDVSTDIVENSCVIKRYLQDAAAAGAKVILFPECALSGYHALTCFDEETGYWVAVEKEIRAIQAEAARLGLWVVLGTVYRESSHGKPRNSIVVIDGAGRVAGRYDKRRFWGRDCEFYSPGTEPLVLNIEGMTCGFLICYDSCFPALYEDYRHRGVEILFHAFFNAGNKGGETDMDTMIYCQQVARAADNGFWIVVSNSSLPHSRLGAGFFGPDGSVKALPKNRAGIISTTLPPETFGWTYAKPKAKRR